MSDICHQGWIPIFFYLQPDGLCIGILGGNIRFSLFFTF